MFARALSDLDSAIGNATTAAMATKPAGPAADTLSRANASACSAVENRCAGSRFRQRSTQSSSHGLSPGATLDGLVRHDVAAGALLQSPSLRPTAIFLSTFQIAQCRKRIRRRPR